VAAARLFRRHDAASQAKYQDTKQLARSQARVLSGTPGTLKLRTQSGNRYWVREHIRVDGRKVDEYLGPEKSLDKARVDALRDAIALARGLAAASAQLRLLGYQRVERKPAAVLEVLFNHGLFQAGLTLVGSHAYGALLNELGVIAPGYRTQDVDLARAQPLTVALPAGMDLRRLLQETGLAFVPVPGMPSHAPSVSFKLPGRETLAVDLLVSGREAGRAVPVRELGAHAQSIPLLDYLIDDPIDAVILSPNQVIPVVLPSPERFLLHKLYASQSRRSDRGKSRKDLEQAAVLAAALEEEAPGSLLGAFKSFPQKGRPSARRAARAAASLLDGVHEEAREALLAIAGKQT
jgi:hypothetical protein